MVLGRSMDVQPISKKGVDAITRIQRFFIAAPHLPEGVWSSKEIYDVLDDILNKHEYGQWIDENRCYLTGVSLGGKAVIETALDRPKRFAAIAPVCPYDGLGLKDRIDKIKDLPIWLFHGSEDGLEKDGSTRTKRSPKNSVGLYAQLAGWDVGLCIYPGVGHTVWIQAYNTCYLYDWFLDHTRAV
jgi:predicted peptidase